MQWKVTLETPDGHLRNVWTIARDPDEAAASLRVEYWDHRVRRIRLDPPFQEPRCSPLWIVPVLIVLGVLAFVLVKQ